MVQHKAALLGNSAHAMTDKAKRLSMTIYPMLILFDDTCCSLLTLSPKQCCAEQSVSAFHIHCLSRCRPIECLYQSTALELPLPQHNLPLINLRSLLRDSCGREICPPTTKTVAVLLLVGLSVSLLVAALPAGDMQDRLKSPYPYPNLTVLQMSRIFLAHH